MLTNFVGNKLKTLRTYAGYSLEQLAHYLGCEAETVERWECGAEEPKLTQLVVLSKLYGVSMDDLFSGVQAESLVDEQVREEYKHEMWLNELSSRSVKW